MRTISFGELAIVAAAALTAPLALALFPRIRLLRISTALLRLQDTTRGDSHPRGVPLAALFVVLPERLGLEAILGALLAWAIVKLVDRDQTMTHP